MSTDDDQRSSAAPDDERLDSWKEIAAFLQRDVRTVQRWEKTAGLPVHRHAASRLRTAYAYRSELDTWWHARRLSEDGVDAHAAASVDVSLAGSPVRDEAEPPRPGTTSIPRAWSPAPYLISASACAVLLVLPLIVLALARHPPAEPVAGSPIATVALLPFDNQVDNPRLCLALFEAIARDLSTNRIELAAPARLSRALRLLRRAPGAQLNEAIGREVAMRDGAIPYLIAGTVRGLGSHLYASLRVVDAADGRVRVRITWDADDPAELIAGAAGAAATLAARLSAKPPAAPPEPLELVTTPSLSALRLYTAAVQAGMRKEWGASELLARRATAADPEFASAYAWTGWAMRQQARPVRECLPPLERAAALASGTTDRESYLIGAMLHNVTGNLPAASAALEAVLRLNPSDPIATDLLTEVYFRQGRLNKAVDLAVARAEGMPGDFAANVRAAQALTIASQDPERRQVFTKRALDLATPAAIRERPSLYAWLNGLPVFERWLSGETREAVEAVRALESTLSSRVSRERDAFAGVVGFAYLAFGMPRDAERAFRHAASPDRQLNLAVLALSTGNERQARHWLLQAPQLGSVRPALFARVGLTLEAERGLDATRPSEHREGQLLAARGIIDARHGRRESAMSALRRSVDLLRWSGEPEYFLALEELVRLSRSLGDTDRVQTFLTAAAAERAHTYGRTQWTAAQWARLSVDLAALHEQRGQHADAERVNASLPQVLRLGLPIAAIRRR